MAWTERYVRADADGAGDGTTDANSGGTGSWTLTQAVANEAAGMRINVKAGTYASTTTTRTLAATGTATQPIWWRGYNTTIGDIDTDNALVKPSLTFTTGRVIVSGAHHIVSNLDVLITGAAGAAAFSTSTASFHGDRLRIEHQQATANAAAVSCGTAAGAVFTRGWFKATSTATQVVSGGVAITVDGCYITGGITGINTTQSNSLFRHCIINGPTTNGIALTTGQQIFVIGCTIYNTTNGITSTNPGNGCVIEDNLFHTLTNGINNTLGTNVNNWRRLHNAFYSVTNAEVGFGDSPSFSGVTESADPLANAAGGDFRLVATANARGAGSPGGFENASLVSYLDIGAVQRAEPATARAIVMARASTY
jgi:hypothetical protein